MLLDLYYVLWSLNTIRGPLFSLDSWCNSSWICFLFKWSVMSDDALWPSFIYACVLFWGQSIKISYPSIFIFHDCPALCFVISVSSLSNHILLVPDMLNGRVYIYILILMGRPTSRGIITLVIKTWGGFSEFISVSEFISFSYASSSVLESLILTFLIRSSQIIGVDNVLFVLPSDFSLMLSLWDKAYYVQISVMIICTMLPINAAAENPQETIVVTCQVLTSWLIMAIC